ncbi:neurexin-1-like [Acropora muricata]|uniref:neurexin-1-like n=1 Tax=Acropora muricata TaxID=159855 RepID=UPI0034E484D0
MTRRHVMVILLLMMASILPKKNILVESGDGLRFTGRMGRKNSPTVSHAEYEPWNWRPDATLQFFFQTSSREKALLFYQGDTGQKDQFMDLFLIPGQARLRARIGKTMAETEESMIEHDFADNRWHKVKIQTTEKEIIFSIDDIYHAKPNINFTKNDEQLAYDSLFVAGIPLKRQNWSNRDLFDEVFLIDARESLFQGCIGDIRLNRSPNGRLEKARQMRTPVDAEETCPGACHTEKCANGGRCIDMIQQWECDCSGTGYEGETCSTESKVVRMKGEGGYISQQLGRGGSFLSTERNTMHFMFLTEAKDGVLFYMGKNKDHLLVELVNGSLRAQANFGGGPVIAQVGKNDLSDSCWHFVEIRRRKRRLTVIIDRGRNGRDSKNSSETYSTLNLSNQSNVIYYGGGPREVLHFAQAKQLSFKGFLKQFQFEEFSVIDNALNEKQGFSISDTDLVWQVLPFNLLLINAEGQCNPLEASACSPGEGDSDSCRTSSTTKKTKGTNFESTTRSTQSSATQTIVTENPLKSGTQADSLVAAKQRGLPTPRPESVSAWVIVTIVMAAVAVVLLSIFLIYRWNHRYTGSFKPSKNEEGQPQEPGREMEQQNTRVYNQPAFFLYKPPKKISSTTESPPVSI